VLLTVLSYHRRSLRAFKLQFNLFTRIQLLLGLARSPTQAVSIERGEIIKVKSSKLPLSPHADIVISA
jgi:hypothetical protein